MPTNIQLQKHEKHWTKVLQTFGLMVLDERDYEAMGYSCAYNDDDDSIFNIEVNEAGINCCGILVLEEFPAFVSMDIAANDDLYKKKHQICCAFMELIKHEAWKANKSLMYASIEVKSQKDWMAVFDETGWVQEHELKNRNTGNTIAVYSFNLLDWKI